MASDTDVGLEKVLRAGDYRKLTVFRKLKLGAAPFVNPALLKKANVAYKINLTDAVSAVGKSSGISEFEAGKVALARWDPSTEAYVVVEEVDSDDLLSALNKAAEENYASDLKDMDAAWVVLSQAPNALGTTTKDAFVSWDASAPIK